MFHLVTKTTLAIAISISARIQTLQHTWLFLAGRIISIMTSTASEASVASSVTVKTSGASWVLVSATVKASLLSLHIVVKTADTRVCLTMVSSRTNIVAYTSASGAGSASGASGASGATVVTRDSLFSLETELLESSRELLVVLARWAIILFVCAVLTTRENTTRILEFVKGLHGQSRQTMVLGGGLCMMGLFDPFVVLEVSHLTCESLLSILLVVMVELSFLGR